MKRKNPHEARNMEGPILLTSQLLMPKSVESISMDFSSHLTPPKGDDDEMNEIVNGNQHSFKVILPKRVGDHTDSELRLMLVTLKNAIVASSVHISKIEHEMRKRDTDSRILSGPRPELLSRIEIDEDVGDIEWETQIKGSNSVAT